MSNPSLLDTLLPDDEARRAFLIDLADTQRPLDQMREAHGLAFDQVLDLVDDPATWRRLYNVLRLEALRGAIAVHRYRAFGLFELVRQVSPGGTKEKTVDETTRRAATDLLKAEVHQPLPPGALRAKLQTAMTAADEDAARPITLLPEDLPPNQFAYALHEALCGREVGDPSPASNPV